MESDVEGKVLPMRYQVRVEGRIFAGDNVRELLRRAVEAKRAAVNARRLVRFCADEALRKNGELLPPRN